MIWERTAPLVLWLPAWWLTTRCYALWTDCLLKFLVYSSSVFLDCHAEKAHLCSPTMQHHVSDVLFFGRIEYKGLEPTAYLVKYFWSLGQIFWPCCTHIFVFTAIYLIKSRCIWLMLLLSTVCLYHQSSTRTLVDELTRLSIISATLLPWFCCFSRVQ